MQDIYRSALNKLLHRQLGLAASRQLDAIGIPANVVGWARRSGELIVFRRGVLGAPSAPPHPLRPLLAACLAAGADAVASHWAAAAVHGLKGVAPGTVEISVPGRARLTDAVVHDLTAPLHPLDQDRSRDVPVTSVARTLIDLAGTGRLWLVERALDDALVRGLCQLPDLQASVDRASGRRGLAGMRTLLRARTDERVDSHQELRWIRLLRSNLGVEPVLHHQVVLPEGIFEIDIAFPAALVGFEVNGWVAHGTRSAFDHDAKKGLALLGAGWRIGSLTSAMGDQLVVRSARLLLGWRDGSNRHLGAS